MRSTPPTNNDIVLVKDSREPDMAWDVHFEAPCEVKCLKTGDYSLVGYEDEIAVERKTLGDLIGCLSSSRDRFVKELERAQQLQYFAVIIEATWGEIVSGQYRSKLHVNSANGSICAWEIRYKVPFFCCGNQELAARKCESLLRKYHREKLKETQEVIQYVFPF